MHGGFCMVNNDKAPLLFVYLPAETEASHIFIGVSCQDKHHIGFAAHFQSYVFVWFLHPKCRL